MRNSSFGPYSSSWYFQDFYHWYNWLFVVLPPWQIQVWMPRATSDLSLLAASAQKRPSKAASPKHAVHAEQNPHGAGERTGCGVGGSLTLVSSVPCFSLAMCPGALCSALGPAGGIDSPTTLLMANPELAKPWRSGSWHSWEHLQIPFSPCLSPGSSTNMNLASLISC